MLFAFMTALSAKRTQVVLSREHSLPGALRAPPLDSHHRIPNGTSNPTGAVGNSTRTGREPRGQKKGRKRAENGGWNERRPKIFL